MSNPEAKRRRLNAAAKTLHKPFKTPLRTPLKLSDSSDSPSLASPDISAPSYLGSSNKSNGEIDTTPTFQAPSSSVLCTPTALKSRVPLSAPSAGITPRPLSKISTAREIMQLRNEIQMLTQAYSLATSKKDEELVTLTDRWRAASRAAAEELFASTRDRVNRMGGVRAWQQREREAKQRLKKWDQEDIQAEKEKFKEAMENGEVSDEVYAQYAELSEERLEEDELGSLGTEDESFTMDMMLKTLNIDLNLIGYNKEAQRWDG